MKERSPIRPLQENERDCVRSTVESPLYDRICRTGDDQCRKRFRTAAADVDSLDWTSRAGIDLGVPRIDYRVHEM
jgi:hypothetical protein